MPITAIAAELNNHIYANLTWRVFVQSVTLVIYSLQGKFISTQILAKDITRFVDQTLTMISSGSTSNSTELMQQRLAYADILNKFESGCSRLKNLAETLVKSRNQQSDAFNLTIKRHLDTDFYSPGANKSSRINSVFYQLLPIQAYGLVDELEPCLDKLGYIVHVLRREQLEGQIDKLIATDTFAYAEVSDFLHRCLQMHRRGNTESMKKYCESMIAYLELTLCVFRQRNQTTVLKH